MMVNLSLVENALAAAGPVRVFVKLLGPDGAEVTTVSREVDYQGAEVDMSIYINKVPEYFKGTYNVEVYTKQGRLGAADVTLR